MYQKKQKEKNNLNFMNYIYSNRTITISSAAKELSLTYPTAKRIVDELLDLNLLIKKQNITNSVGRSATAFSLNENSLFSIGIHIEVNRLSFVLINLFGVIVREKILKKIMFTEENFLSTIIEEFDEFYSSLSNKQDIIGVGISFPGIVNNEELKIIQGINMKLKNISLNELRERYELDFYIENEAKASIYSEKILGLAENLNDFILLSIASGIGMGTYLDSKICRGMNGMGGEVGHTSFVVDGELCKCGNRGCWELYASELSLINKYYDIKGISVESKGSNILSEIFTSEERIVEDYIKKLSIGIRNMMFTYDIENIIISGDISSYLSDHKKKIVEILKDNIFFENININLMFSELKGSSSLLGAALIPISKYFNLIRG